MNINIQLLSFIFSFSYGIIISYLYNLFYIFLETKVLRYKILSNFLFYINIFLIYFILLRKINDGVIHIYFILLTLLSFYLFINRSISLRKVIKCKNQSNNIDKSRK